MRQSDKREEQPRDAPDAMVVCERGCSSIREIRSFSLDGQECEEQNRSRSWSIIASEASLNMANQITWPRRVTFVQLRFFPRISLSLAFRSLHTSLQTTKDKENNHDSTTISTSQGVRSSGNPFLTCLHCLKYTYVLHTLHFYSE